MDKLRAAARQALEALEQWKEHDAWHKRNDWNDEDESAITALREALAEQVEQEPVAWVEVERGIPMFMNFTEDYKPYINNGIASLYAAPVRTKDLTDDEILEITKRFALGIAFPVDGVTTPEMFARAVIAADREKNRE